MANATSNQGEALFSKALKKLNVQWQSNDAWDHFKFLLPNSAMLNISKRDVEAMIRTAVAIKPRQYVNFGRITAFNFHDAFIQEMQVIYHGYKKKPTEGYDTYDDKGGHDRGSAHERQRDFYDRFQQANAEYQEFLKAHQGHKNSLSEYHLLIGVGNPFTQEQLKIAYRAKMMKWHPDKNQDKIEEATEMCKKINEAYKILKSVAK